MQRYLLTASLLCPACSNPRSAGPQQAAPPANQPSRTASSAPPPAASAEQPNRADGAATTPSSPAASASAGTRSVGATQPKWTMIEGVRDCTGTILSQYVCTPGQRPAKCSAKAWQELTSLSGRDALTPCALESDIKDCSAPYPDEATARCWPEKRLASCSDEKWGRVKDVKLVFACPSK